MAWSTDSLPIMWSSPARETIASRIVGGNGLGVARMCVKHNLAINPYSDLAIGVSELAFLQNLGSAVVARTADATATNGVDLIKEREFGIATVGDIATASLNYR